jgi:hypothetical protein
MAGDTPIVQTKLTYNLCGLYYKPITIVNDDFSSIYKLQTSLTDDARVVIYDRHMFIVQATESIHNGLL